LTETAFLTLSEGIALTRIVTGRDAAMISSETTGEKSTNGGHRRAGRAASVKPTDADMAPLYQEVEKAIPWMPGERQ